MRFLLSCLVGLCCILSASVARADEFPEELKNSEEYKLVAAKQEAFIKAHGFTPGVYVECRDNSKRGCAASREEFLGTYPPMEEGVYKETAFWFRVDGRLSMDLRGESMPDEAEMSMERSGDLLIVRLRLPQNPGQTVYTFTIGTDYLESVDTGQRYTLALDAIHLYFSS